MVCCVAVLFGAAFAASVPAGRQAAQGSMDWGAPVRTMTPAGRPVSGVKIYSGDLQPAGGGWDYLGTTGASGTKKPDALLPTLIGIAPDGRVAVSTSSHNLVFGATATLRLHLANDHGKALPNMVVSLFPAETAAPLSNTGALRPMPDIPPAVFGVFSRLTDISGNAEYPKLPKGVPFRVLIRTADRQNVLALNGTVKPGQKATAILAGDLRVSGRATTAKGAPAAGVEVVLESRLGEWYDPSLGTPIARTTTDASGAYRFNNLPNCLVNVRLSLAKTKSKRGVIRSKVGSGSWSPESYEGPDLPQLFQEHPADVLGANRNQGTTFSLRQSTTCDFRMFDPAVVDVEFVSRNPFFLKGYTISVSNPTAGSGAGCGEDIDGRAYVPLVLSPGPHTITISRFAEDAAYVLTRIDVRQAGRQRIRCVLPKNLPLKPLTEGFAAQNGGGPMSPFKAKGSDGRAYDLKSLMAGGPVFLVNFSGWDKQSAFSDMNRLAGMLRGKVRVVGVTGGDRNERRRLVKRFGVKFLLLSDDELLFQQFAVGHNGRDVYGLANALILPDGRWTHIWAGYNRSTLRQMAIDLRRATGVKLSLDLRRFPTRIRVGDFGMIGLPGP